MTVTGAEGVLVESHRGRLGYCGSEVEIAGSARVRIRGDGLLLRAMDREMLLVTGRIFGVDLD
ncbi:MAG: YabP/YqfC family sporulation protein [Oscillospiraceae bacterium]|nr:YabP/YqfC family sporulation protein [Oscillospiraceae bacterium]